MFEQVTGSLDLPKIKRIDENEEIFYFVDFTKMKSVNDLVKVLATMGFGISDKNPHYDSIKEFLDLDKPVKLK
jgi:hypothetical protein